MSEFVDHLQILPVPSRGGVRQPDGAHRPGGLGMSTLAERLERRGWTARVEDIGFDRPLPERRIAESYARSIADGVASAWERRRFPIVLTLVQHGALGVVDALGPRAGVVWVSPRAGYERPGLLRRPSAERAALAMITGRAPRDRMAVRPMSLSPDRIVLVGAGRVKRSERAVLAADGARFTDLETLKEVVASVDAEAWYVHVDASALSVAAAPAADEPDPEGWEPAALAEGLCGALEDRSLRCVGIARYDLNRHGGERTADALIEVLEAAALSAGGQPRPTPATGH